MATMLLTTDELATELRCSRDKAKQLIKRGVVKSVLIDGMRRIRRTDLEDYLASLVPSLPVNQSEAA